jgi:hypothetical protein
LYFYASKEEEEEKRLTAPVIKKDSMKMCRDVKLYAFTSVPDGGGLMVSHSATLPAGKQLPILTAH